MSNVTIVPVFTWNMCNTILMAVNVVYLVVWRAHDRIVHKMFTTRSPSLATRWLIIMIHHPLFSRCANRFNIFKTIKHLYKYIMIWRAAAFVLIIWLSIVFRFKFTFSFFPLLQQQCGDYLIFHSNCVIIARTPRPVCARYKPQILIVCTFCCWYVFFHSYSLLRLLCSACVFFLLLLLFTSFTFYFNPVVRGFYVDRFNFVCSVVFKKKNSKQKICRQCVILSIFYRRF